ncbi:membrane protein [Polaribacter pacificus]|uniref:Membrane protein n=1 Tax=Polaribacter pacificus TaxID=1775173 RepID=A0A917HZC4_9FLAO|nr:metal-dependent hydrolase [Polaribacter pacificus]GGG95947.1 membrane protein [Polaribacter pacificus]
MDSLTQIVLGAACGELILGKKIGNKALLFGAIGGTIPDLDVLLGALFYSNSIDQLAFHRGIMHSLVFAIIAAMVLGFVVFEAYNTKKRKHSTTLKDWMLLFLFSIGTHPILDSFTPYGTQLFAPFSDVRIAFNNISVIDPFYTLPFLICMIVVLFLKRNNPMRLTWAKAGIYISSVYMVCTLFAKIYIDSVFKNSYKKAGIETLRFRTQPTALNAILWYGIAETKEDYVLSYYSLFDSSSTANKMIHVSKNHELLYMNAPDLKKMAWFSDAFFMLEPIKNSNHIKYNDLRYVLPTEKDSINAMMTFTIKKKGDRFETTPPEYDNLENFSVLLNRLFTRLKGI